MKKKNFNNVLIERKRIRWSSLKKTTRTFVSVIIFVAFFAIVIILFSIIFQSFLDLIS